MIANDAFLQSLSEEDRAVVRQAAVEGMKVQRAAALAENDSILSKMTEDGAKIYVPTDSELDQYKAIAKPVYDTFKDKIGVSLVETVENEVRQIIADICSATPTRAFWKTLKLIGSIATVSLLH